jgi:hypothetical protein
MKCYTLLLLIVMLVAPTLVAQSNTPDLQSGGTVEVVLDHTTVRPHSLINADVFVQADFIAGADIAIDVDPTCLRVETLLSGEYLPTTVDDGGFSPYQEFNDSHARLAANVTETSKITSERGRFFRAQIRVICDAPAEAVIWVTRAELVNDRLQIVQPATRDATVFVSLDASQSSPSTIDPLIFVAMTLAIGSLIGMIILYIVWRKHERSTER